MSLTFDKARDTPAVQPQDQADSLGEQPLTPIEVCREMAAWIRRRLEDLTSQMVTDANGRIVNSFAAAVIPDWDLKQKLEMLDETIDADHADPDAATGTADDQLSPEFVDAARRFLAATAKKALEVRCVMCDQPHDLSQPCPEDIADRLTPEEAKYFRERCSPHTRKFIDAMDPRRPEAELEAAFREWLAAERGSR